MKSEVRSQKSEVRSQKSEVRSQIFCSLFSVFCLLSSVFCLPSVALAKEGPLFSVSAQETRYFFSKADRDPFSPLVSKSGVVLIARKMDIGGLNIKGIIYSETSSVAIINDEVVGKGDMIGEYFVLEIEEKRVVLRKNDEEFILKLEEEE